MRKTIVIVGIIMSFILGTLVSGPFATAQMGTPFLQEEIDAIEAIIQEMQEQLDNLHVTWESVTDKPYVVLHYEQSDPVSVPSTIQLPDLIELAVWQIVKDPAFVYDDTSTPIFDSSVFANIIGNVDIGWYKSEDRIFWNTIHEISASNFGFEVESDFIPQSSLSSETNFIAFGTANPFNEGDNNVVKDFSGTVTIHLPPGQSLVRISLP